MGVGPKRGRDVARYACFAAFMSTLFIYSPNVMTLFSFDKAEYTGTFAEPCLTATLISACVLIVGELCGKSVVIERILSRFATKVACIAVYLASCLLFIACILLQIPDIALHLGFIGAICGISLMGMCLIWAEAFHDVDLFKATIAMVGALLASATLHATSGLCPRYVLLSLEVILLLCGSLPLLAFSCPVQEVDVVPGEGVQEPSECKFAWGEHKGRAFASVMGVPLVGMAISSLAIGVRPFYIFDNTVNVQVCSMFLAVLLFAPLIALRKKQPLYAFVYQAYLPVLIALATATAMLLREGILSEVACVFLCATFTLATVIAVAASAAISNAREFPRGLVFATLIAVYSGLGITGIRIGATYSALYENNQVFLIFLAVLYTCGMLVFSSLKVWKATTNSTGDENIAAINPEPAPASKNDETFEERLARISEKGGLSVRETQIMSYVGKGHTSVYVAKTLLISDSTVYTHVRNIYRKLGISSREELIQLLNDSES